MTDTTYAVELTPPDISAYRKGNTGVDYVTTFDSGVPGPHAMVAAVVHGNELCGAITLDYVFKQAVRPKQGKLTLAFMNIAAYESFDPAHPENSRFVDEDFNRVWGKDVLDGARQTVETRRTRDLRPIIDQVDFILDIHSMQHKTVPLGLCGPTAKGQAFARALSYPEYVMADAGHAAGKRLRDYGAFGDEASSKNALLIECGQHWEAASERVAKESTFRYLTYLDVIDAEVAETCIGAFVLPKQKVVQVESPITIETDRFRFAEDYIGMEVIAEAGTIIGWDDDKEIRTPFDECVLIMPSRRRNKGTTAVRLGRFV